MNLHSVNFLSGRQVRLPLLISSVIILIYTLVIGCSKESIPECDDSDSLFSYSSFPIGVAIDYRELTFNDVYRSVATKQFNSITPENIFKADYLHPDSNRYYWDDADSLVGFCMLNNKRIHGHTLIWHKQLPEWILEFKGNSTEWDRLMRTHIQTIVGHFRGKVSGWDVVNEAFNEDGTLRNTIWLQNIGPSYIEKAFTYAHEADPDALLFYNDFNIEPNLNKRNSVIGLMNALRNRGIQVDGIGIQMHVNILNFEPDQLALALQGFVSLGYKIHLSELDISINPLGQDIQATSELLSEQASLLGEIVLQYKQIPVQDQYGITFWGLSDRNSWISGTYHRKDFPLLYDENYKPKPCFCKLKETL